MPRSVSQGPLGGNGGLTTVWAFRVEGCLFFIGHGGRVALIHCPIVYGFPFSFPFLHSLLRISKINGKLAKGVCFGTETCRSEA